MDETPLAAPPPLRIGSPVTPSDHRQDQHQGTIIHIHGSWARVRWTIPDDDETLEWLPNLRLFG